MCSGADDRPLNPSARPKAPTKKLSGRSGYPIRQSRDLRICASPPGFSQLVTAFFARIRQGIPHKPVFRLTILLFPHSLLASRGHLEWVRLRALHCPQPRGCASPHGMVAHCGSSRCPGCEARFVRFARAPSLVISKNSRFISKLYCKQPTA